MKLIIVVPVNRDQLGTVSLVNAAGQTLIDKAVVLCRSDKEFADGFGNTPRDPMQRGGDTPYGTYSCTISKFTPPVDEPHEHSYGPYGFILLTPTGGDALKAAENGRRGIGFHSGVLNPVYTQWQGLRPTHGCSRVKDETMLDILTECAAVNETLTCEITPP